MNRNSFLRKSILAAGAVSLPSLGEAQPVTAEDGRGPGRGPRTDLRPVLDFVQAAHRDLEKVKSMLATDPSLIIASWDWGNGDWETGLEGAAHMGRQDIVRYLLENGADNPNTKNFFGKTPLDAALDRDFNELAELLRQNGGQTSG